MENNIIIFTKDKVVYMCTILKKIKNKTPLELLEENSIKLKPPIDIALLLDKLGISSISKDFTEIEKKANCQNGEILGAAISVGENLAIFYKKSDTYHRKIFTIAHELGHCCKHTDNLKIAHIELRTSHCIEDCNEEHECEANIFAGELLIPESVLLPIYNKFVLPSLKALSDIFNVSTTVMAARLDYLGLSYYKDTNISEE